MPLSRFIVPALACILAAGCASRPASYDYDEAVDFRELRRWSWQPRAEEQPSGDPRIDNPLTRQRIESAVARELAAKGYDKATRDTADFDVGYLMMIDKRLGSTSVGASIGFGRYSGGSGVGVSIGGPTTPLREYEEGTLIIDVKHRESGKLLWRGSSRTRLSRTGTPEESEQLINRIVGEILANFPPPVDGG